MEADKQRDSAWPVPAEWPLYVSIDRAAAIAGVSQDTMRAWANRQDNPVPHIQTGNKKLIRVAALPEYCAAMEA